MRLIVHKDVKDELLGLVAKHLQDWQLGDPLDPENRLGAMVSKAHFDKVRSYLEYAAEQKLSVVQGGETLDGVFVQPTIVDGVSRDSRLFIEEIFGPVLAVTTFETVDEAIELANDTVYGLAACAMPCACPGRSAPVWSRPTASAKAMPRRRSVATSSPALAAVTNRSGPTTSTPS